MLSPDQAIKAREGRSTNKMNVFAPAAFGSRVLTRTGSIMHGDRIKEHMEFFGADGVHVGTVDRVENGKIKLT
jgi:hypothetical protein